MFSNISKKILLKDFLLNILPSVSFCYMFLSRSNIYLENCSERSSLICNFFACIGYIFVIKVILDSTIAFYRRKIRVGRSYIQQPYRWAIITAATSAVGQAFARKLAKAGMNLILIGKDHKKLHHLVNFIEEENPKVRAKIIVHDFAHDSSKEFREALSCKLDKLLSQYKASKRGGISMLVHCANSRNEVPVEMHDMDLSERNMILQSNITGTCDVIETILPYMIQQGNTKHNGSIIFINSHACHHPTPMMSVYSATNQFRNSLSQSLYHDLKDVGISVLSVTPELMSSNMPRKSDNARLTKAPSADKIVRTALANVGHQEECFPFIGHIQSTVMQNNVWSHPWERFLNKMRIARSEILLKKHMESAGHSCS